MNKLDNEIALWKRIGVTSDSKKGHNKGVTQVYLTGIGLHIGSYNKKGACDIDPFAVRVRRIMKHGVSERTAFHYVYSTSNMYPNLDKLEKWSRERDEFASMSRLKMWQEIRELRSAVDDCYESKDY